MAGYNPFIDTPSEGNPFVTLTPADRTRQEREVERALHEYQGTPSPTRNAAVFGSPVSAPSSGETVNFSSSSPALAGAWGAKPKTKPAAFEIATDTPPGSSGSSSKIGAGRSSNWSSPRNFENGSNADNRETKLNVREQELRRREDAVARREAALQTGRATGSKNWPRCYPLLHHDIQGDVPADKVGLVKSHYVTWLIIASGYIWNFIMITIFWIAGQKDVSLWLMSGIIAFAGLPLSFLCWYRPLYNAAINDSALRWFGYFINMLANIVWCWWMFVGVRPKMGAYSAGLFEMIHEFSRNSSQGTAFGVLCIINMVLFGLGGLFSMILMGRAFKMFRGKPVTVRTTATWAV